MTAASSPVRTMASLGTTGPAALAAPKSVAVAYMPGRSRPPVLTSVTRAVPVRVAGSMVS